MACGAPLRQEVGVQRDTQDIRGPVQQSHCVTDSHLRMESGLVGFWCKVSYHQPTSPEWRWVDWPWPSHRPPQCWEQKPVEWSWRRRTSCLGQELGSLTQSGWRGLGRWLIPVGPPLPARTWREGEWCCWYRPEGGRSLWSF